VLKKLLDKVRELIGEIRERLADGESFYEVRYSSAPLWKPWRDY
jgi:hypothetical protein